MAPYRVYFELGDGRLVEYRRSGRYLPSSGRHDACAQMSFWRALVFYAVYAVFILKLLRFCMAAAAISNTSSVITGIRITAHSDLTDVHTTTVRLLHIAK